MKKKVLMLSFMICLSLTMLVTIHLAFFRGETSDFSEDKARYVFLAPNMEEKFWVNIAEGIRTADQEMGSDTLLVHYRYEDDLGGYIRDARLSGAQGIIVRGFSRGIGDTAKEEEIRKAVDSGIPVLLYDSDDSEGSRTAFVGSDNIEFGKTAARALVQEMGEEGNYLLIVRGIGIDTMRMRIDGVEEVMSAYPGVVLVETIEDGNDLLTLRQHLQNYLTEGKNIRGILALGGLSADYLGELLQNFGVDQEKMAVVVTDLTEQAAVYLTSGDYDAVIELDAWQVGYRSVELLNQYYSEGEEIASKNLLEAEVVTGDNLSRYTEERGNAELEWNSY